VGEREKGGGGERKEGEREKERERKIERVIIIQFECEDASVCNTRT
jgi:hypothetical protein